MSSDRITKDGALARLATPQLGLVTPSTGLAAGVSVDGLAYRRGAGRLATVRRGVSRVVGVPASWEQVVLAACLAAGDPVAASHLTAACLRLFLRIVRPEWIELTVERPRHPRLAGVRAHRVPALDPADIGVVSGIPTTTAARTIVDIAGALPRRRLDAVVNDLLRRRLLTVAGLAGAIERAERSRVRRPYKLLHELVEKRSNGFHPGDSEPELWMVRTLVAAGLPRPVQQYRVRARGRDYVLDCAYPECKVGMEYDGFDGHGNAVDLAPDRRRLNDLSAVGWDVRYATWETTDRALVDDVRAALQRAGAVVS